MKKMVARLAAVVALASMTTFAMAADWNKDQAAVWSVVTQSWEDEVAKNGNWPKNYVHKDVVAWGESWPQPREAASIAKWSRFGEKTDTTLIYELFPVSIVVVESTAIVNYNTVSVGNNYEGKRERSTQGLIETLVYDGKSWRFLSLTSFEINSDHQPARECMTSGLARDFADESTVFGGTGVGIWYRDGALIHMEQLVNVSDGTKNLGRLVLDGLNRTTSIDLYVLK